MAPKTTRSLKIRFDEAIAHHQQGRFEEAERIYRTLLAEEPERADLLNLFGILLAQTSREKESLVYLEKAVSLAPDDPFFRNNLAKILTDSETATRQDLAAAEGHLKAALERRPNYPEALNNLGNVLQKRHRAVEAESFYRKALIERPNDALTESNLGSALLTQGRFEEAGAYYSKALERAPGEPTFHSNMARLLFKKTPPILWEVLVEKLLEIAPLRETESYDLHIKAALGAWLANAPEKTLQHLEQAASSPRRTGKLPAATLAFEHLLQKLYAVRQKEASLYQTASSLPLFAVIGESNALSYANLVLNMEGTTYRVRSDFIGGCKAYHLTEAPPNEYKGQLASALDRLPGGTPTLLLFGEIDCRWNSGILPHARATGTPLKETAAQTAKAYVEKAAEIGVSHNLPLYLATVPAPNLALLSEDFDQETGSALIRTIEVFNETLREETHRRKVSLIDFHRLTQNEKGGSNGLYHLDPNHLQPRSLKEASISK